MDSSDLYNVRQQFTLGAFNTVADLQLPDTSSNEYSAFLLYKARACLALGRAKEVTSLIPNDTDSLSLKAVSSLARYDVAASSTGSDDKDAALEELRDLCVEIESDEVDEAEKGRVKVLAGTAFVREGENEEALETLGAGGSSEDLEATALIVQIYLSIDRPDLAKKEYERALKWAEDDLLLQSIEASIGLVTGADSYSNSYSYYSEQLGNPSLTSPHLLTSRGVTRLLRGEVAEAKSDLEEALHAGEDEETLIALVAAAGLAPGKKGEADELYSDFAKKYPSSPFVHDIREKSDLFDTLTANFTVPPKAVVTGA